MQTDTDQEKTQRDEKTSFTLEEAAAFLEVRADDLTATLSSAGIELNTRKDGLLTRDDVKRLERLVSNIRHIASESVYGGGNL